LDPGERGLSLAFGDCDFDQDARQLSRAGKPVGLTPKAFQLLELMLQRRPRAVSKAEIYERLWPGTFVAEVNLSRLIFEVRAALGDNARRPLYVRTVRGFGYAFCADVRTAAVARISEVSAPWYALFEEEREIPLHEGENLIGRSRADAVMLQSTSVSRRHARLTISGDSARIEDLGSKNGTFVNGRRTEGAVTLVDGDIVRVGTVKLLFRIIPPEVPTTTGREEPGC
jgi:DNA-binding winged helix-turn-helix (wHTH) protein